MLVGEQPGDKEDRQGLPFVGPAGRLLDEALEAAGIDRRETYVTNAVKHFKWVPAEGRGKRRIHQKPNAAEIRACHPWLLAEIAAVEPSVIVCLGATAAQALLGAAFRVTKQRGVPCPTHRARRLSRPFTRLRSCGRRTAKRGARKCDASSRIFGSRGPCWRRKQVCIPEEIVLNERRHSMRGKSRTRSSGRKYGKTASRKVKAAMHERKRGTLSSGGSGRKVKSRKQAIAIGLSEARRSGAKVPRRK